MDECGSTPLLSVLASSPLRLSISLAVGCSLYDLEGLHLEKPPVLLS